jgi:hypothetical protein
MKHRLTIFALGVLGTILGSAVNQGFIPAAIGGAAGALVGEILTYEQSQPV